MRYGFELFMSELIEKCFNWKKYAVFLILIQLNHLFGEGIYYSQSGQDKYLWESFFSTRFSGVFVDIGAHDGIKYSNTKFFEERGWKGICVEPNPDVFPLLQRSRSAICVFGCILDVPGETVFLKATGYPQMLSGIRSKFDPRHLRRIEKEVEEHHASSELITVQAYLLNDILQEYNFFRIDYLSIDTEGSELDILKSIDFEIFDIEFIDVENNFQEQDVQNFLESKGYKLIKKIGHDDFYRKL